MLSTLWSRRLLIGAVLGGLGLLHMLCPLQIGVVSGASMEPSFHSHQVILIDRQYYRQHNFHRGDVVIARAGGSVLIKRVFAVGGDTFWTLLNADDGDLFREIVDPAMLPRMQRLMPMIPSYKLTRFTVPPGTLYLVGDNTCASMDSRHFGPIPEAAVMGHVLYAPASSSRLFATAPQRGTYPIARASLR